jgi:hypothetical protein
VLEVALCVGRYPLRWKVPFVFEGALCVGRCPLCLKVPFRNPAGTPQLLWPSFFVVVLRSHQGNVMPLSFFYAFAYS